MTGESGNLAVDVGILGYGVATLGYLLIALLVLFAWRASVSKWLFLAACLASVLWSLGAAAPEIAGVVQEWRGFLAPLRTSLWAGLLLAILSSAREGEGRRLTIVTATVLALIPAIHLLIIVFPLVPNEQLVLLLLLPNIAGPVIGLILIESTLRSCDEEQRWRLKFLFLGLGLLFAFDLFLYAQILILGIYSPEIQLSRSLVQVLALPFLTVFTLRNAFTERPIQLSHSAALHSTAFIASGGYLVLMTLGALFIHRYAGEWRTAAQVVFLAGAFAVLFLVLASGAARAKAKVLIGRHIFRSKYDFRAEWRKFTATLSGEERGIPFEMRVIKALADIVESTGGELWAKQGQTFRMLSTWNFGSLTDDRSLYPKLFRRYMLAPDIIDIDAVRYDLGATASEFKESRSFLRSWVLIPLSHRGEVVAWVVLGRPRAKRQLDGEDRELLSLAASQAASHLAEHQAMEALAETREFERFSRQYAFVVHDMKNLVSQLSLLLGNFHRHKDKPEFLEDMMETVGDAVGRMQDLIDRINAFKGEGGGSGKDRLVDLADLLKSEAAMGDAVPSHELEVAERAAEARVKADPERLRHVIAHLIGNAREAAGADGEVTVSLDLDEPFAVLEVSDNGPGMDVEFIQTKLFKPFRSTKSDGLGVGAFQCLDFAREAGGDLRVISSPGSGTTMRLLLPLAGEAGAEEPIRVAGQGR